MPERIHLEDLLGELVHEVVEGKLSHKDFFDFIDPPKDTPLQNFWEKFHMLWLKYEDMSPSHTAGKITQGLLNAYWNEKPTREELAYEDAVPHHAILA